MGDKKDVLDFPLEKVEVPQAIILMMQAATKTVAYTEDGRNAYDVHLKVDNERLAELCEKLEARVQDEIDDAGKVREVATDEDNPNRFEDTSGDDVAKIIREGEIHMVTVNGIIFGRLCNEPVHTYEDPSSGERWTSTCIKQWGHDMEHGDEKGAYK